MVLAHIKTYVSAVGIFYQKKINFSVFEPVIFALRAGEIQRLSLKCSYF